MVRYNRQEAEAGGDDRAAGARLILIENGSNLGYAGANNVGLRFALARSDFSYVWLLNNDTVVTPDALSRLVARMETDPAYGQCGSQLRYYHAPELIQARGGGSYSPWLAAARHVGEGSRASQPVNPVEVERRLSYLVGASVLVSRSFLESVGLLSEEYFFYFEELDWVRRAGGRYKLGYVHESIVYHKGATSVTAVAPKEGLSRLGEFYYTRSRVRFTRIHYPVLLPAVWFTLGAAVLYRLATGRWRDARTLWAALRDPITYAPSPATAASAPGEFAE
jgi:GT2 family glycosyltransferase